MVYQVQPAELLAFLSQHEEHGVEEVEKLAEEKHPGDQQHLADLFLVHLAGLDAPVAACRVFRKLIVTIILIVAIRKPNSHRHG